MKTLLILVDGMRPDALTELPSAQRFAEKSSYSFEARTVFPSVTLPCHMSLFHSVDPDRHGITTNIYMPQVRPVDGLCEALSAAKKKCAFFYNWEQLRDLSRPSSLAHSYFSSGNHCERKYEDANENVTAAAIEYIGSAAPDFAFVYLGWVDEAGHGSGWMSEEYMRAVKNSWDCIDRIVAALPEEYTVIVTADHGGHGRGHGSDLPEDMTIPVFFCGRGFEAGKKLEGVSIKDIAPTIATLMGAEIPEEWEGKSLT